MFGSKLDKMRDKKGIFELVQEEVIQAVIVVIIMIGLIIVINLAASNEGHRISVGTRAYALWLDAAFNTDSYGETELNFRKDLGVFDDPLEILINDEQTMIEIKMEGAQLGKSYRIIKHNDREIKVEETESTLELNVK